MNKEKLYENYWKERNKKEPNRIIKAGKSFSLFNSNNIPLIKDVMIWSYEEGAKAERERIKRCIGMLYVFFIEDMWFASKTEWKNEKDTFKYLRGHFNILYKEIEQKEKELNK